MTEPITIAGAGPAGLAAAIYLARSGRRVRILERANTVGARFCGDQQGIENWSREQDVLAELQAFGIEPTFTTTAVNRIHYGGPGRQLVEMKDVEPFFYLVRRGDVAGSLDRGLLEQAVAAGVEVSFGRRCQAEEADIMATGPRGISGIALGYVFETDAPPTALILLDNQLAPGGYGYLLIADGRGTLATTFPCDYGQGRLFLERTVAAATTLVGLQMNQPRSFGGRGHFFLADRFCIDKRLYCGEAAGLQDFFLGFGMRYAILSGILAARSLLEGLDYEMLIRRNFQDMLRSSIVNRFAAEWLSNRHIDWLIGKVPGIAQPRQFLRRRYGLSWKKRLLYPLARWRLGGRLTEPQTR